MGRVLVADSRIDTVKLLASDLAGAGHDVVTAFDAEAVRTGVETSPPEAIVLGGMRGLDNVELCRQLRENPALVCVPIILLAPSGGGDDLEIRALDAGADHVLRGEFRVATVRAYVRSVLGRRAVLASLDGMVRSLGREVDSAHLRAEAQAGFLASMSHEIRTPLTAILGYADLLLDPRATEDDRASWVQTIRGSGQHLLSLINDVLDFSKIEAHRMTVELLDVDLRQLVEEVVSLVHPRASERRNSLDVVFEDRFPRVMRSDPMRLRQVLVNLCGNAVKFTEGGKVSIVCRLREDGPKPIVSFCIADTGVGMGPETLAQLFRPYSQGDSSVSRRFGGSGLGLSISKAIVELLGGSIGVSSDPGVGSTFEVLLPFEPVAGSTVTPPDSTSAAPQRAQPTRIASRRPLLAGRVLLAEDVPANQKLISCQLSRAGLQVDLAEDGVVAVSRWREVTARGETFDVVLMDMQMPRMDGYTAAAALRKEGFEGPIVALTAHAFEGEREKCLAAGCSDFATKPIDQRTLVEIISRNLGASVESRPSSPTTASVAERNAAAGRDRSGAARHSPSSDQGPIPSELLQLPGRVDPQLTRLVEAFVRDLPRRVDALEQRVSQSDWAGVAGLAHQLKGAAGGYGYPGLGHIVSRIEDCAEGGGDVRTLPLLMRELRSLVERVVARSRSVRL